MTSQLAPKLAAAGLVLKGVDMGNVDLPRDFRAGMERLLAEELETEKMRYTLQLKEAHVKQTQLESQAEAVRRREAAEAAALGLTRPDCIDPNLGVVARAALDEERRHLLEMANVRELSAMTKSRIHARRAAVWASSAFERARRGQPAAPAAQRALTELLSVKQDDLGDDRRTEYVDTVVREAKERGVFRRRFEVLRIDDLALIRFASTPALLRDFGRWQDAAWRRDTLAMH
jgi:hypothetical protein